MYAAAAPIREPCILGQHRAAIKTALAIRQSLWLLACTPEAAASATTIAKKLCQSGNSVPVLTVKKMNADCMPKGQQLKELTRIYQGTW